VIYGIIHDIGGRVEIDRSAELGGARFIVYLPAAKDDHPPDRLRQ